jgi:hypothetical protein
VIKERLSQNAIGELREVADLGDGRVLVVTGIRPDSEVSPADLGLPEGQDETANVVTIREGKVVAMQDYRTRRRRSRRCAEATVEADRVSDLIPFVHVGDLGRSLAFYERLGFSLKARHKHEGRLDWAALEAGSAQLMLALASSPIDRSRQAVLFYLYSHDLSGLRARLLSEGLQVGEIRDGSPGPRQELAMSDPDGYCLMVAQIDG